MTRCVKLWPRSGRNCGHKGAEEMEESVRLLTPEDRPQLEETLRQDQYYNLFLLGNLENRGMRDPDLQYWGHFKGNRLAGVLMRYRRQYWGLYEAGGADLAAFGRIIHEHGITGLTGRDSLVDGLLQVLPIQPAKVYTQYYCRLKNLIGPPGVDSGVVARRAREDDVPALEALYSTAGDLRRTADQLRQSIARWGRIYVTEDGGRIVSAAISTAETRTMAMVVGVFTPEQNRGRGYATTCVAGLCRELLSEGREPCLFYHNPAAGSIYRRLGFEDIGGWKMADFKDGEL